MDKRNIFFLLRSLCLPILSPFPLPFHPNIRSSREDHSGTVLRILERFSTPNLRGRNTHQVRLAARRALIFSSEINCYIEWYICLLFYSSTIRKYNSFTIDAKMLCWKQSFSENNNPKGFDSVNPAIAEWEQNASKNEEIEVCNCVPGPNIEAFFWGNNFTWNLYEKQKVIKSFGI